MRRFLLDTDTCIYVIKHKPESARRRFRQHSNDICTSTITAMELLHGAGRSSRQEANRDIVQGFLSRLEVIDYDIAAAAQTAEIRTELAREGTPIGAYDAMIAGVARSQGLVVVTHNIKEFSRVDGLRVDDWFAAS